MGMIFQTCLLIFTHLSCDAEVLRNA